MGNITINDPGDLWALLRRGGVRPRYGSSDKECPGSWRCEPVINVGRVYLRLSHDNAGRVDAVEAVTSWLVDESGDGLNWKEVYWGHLDSRHSSDFDAAELNVWLSGVLPTWRPRHADVDNFNKA